VRIERQDFWLIACILVVLAIAILGKVKFR
jgi:uncharacterized membrane protein YhaH (DUF805 family)